MTRALILIAIATLAACSGGGGHTNDGETAEPEDGQAVIHNPDGSTDVEEVTITYTNCKNGRTLTLGHDRWRWDDDPWQPGDGTEAEAECHPIG